MLMSEGPIVKRTAPRVPPEECRVFIRDHHDAYISWEEFEENRRMLRSNALRVGTDGLRTSRLRNPDNNPGYTPHVTVRAPNTTGATRIV
jgi:hypothetical protein